MLSGENLSAWVKAASAPLLSPLLAKAIPSSVHNCVSLGESRRAARLNSTALSKSLARRAERMDSRGLSLICARTDETQNKSATEKTSFRRADIDRKSTRLNSSHVAISYAVFCLKKKKE